ncbi:aminoglycoside phosphotransferase family protein [Glycomyces sp. A-F 0318]|uniref:aminoglycoside phosphotransferase family protein n=1 Tax=Glycomyces amatae TaxID=2881355 RepID=UPI001E4CD42E|nr:aminoglycoside phosphotransferase family protein [Glycomyces amatae]MCD0444140.1 aminoglycoside phosphotransferase family protein [Glycomyces amatae]
MDVTRATEQLGLGRSLRPPVVLQENEQLPVWKVETDSGAWVVKLQRPWGDFWLGMAAQTGALEAAAWEAGVAMPEPHSTYLGEAGLWRPVGEDVYARAMRFVEGGHPAPPVAEPLAAWAGGVVAVLEALAIPADPEVVGDYRTHPDEEWDEWFAQAERLGVLDAGQVRAFRHAVARTEEILRADPLAKRPKLVMHRDISYNNVLEGPDGPVLLDFDAAGAQVPWWELVCTAFELAAPGLGVMRPERRVVEACLSGYLAAGGRPGPTDESAFTGMLAGRVSVATWQLWMACGHRGGSPELQARFGRDVRDSVEAATIMLETVPTWAAWLEG